jgi:hypothetical protein
MLSGRIGVRHQLEWPPRRHWARSAATAFVFIADAFLLDAFLQRGSLRNLFHPLRSGGHVLDLDRRTRRENHGQRVDRTCGVLPVAAFLEPVEQWIEGGGAESDGAARALLDQLADLIAMPRSRFDELQDQEFGASLLEFARVGVAEAEQAFHRTIRLI